MNAETGTEPEAPKKRGRIPQSAWPQILERYRSGATLSAIAREFECTPSAISYIIRKAEAAGGTEKDDADPAPAEAVVAESPAADAPVPATAAPAPAPVAPVAQVAEAAPAPARPAPRPERRPAEPRTEAAKPEPRNEAKPESARHEQHRAATPAEERRPAQPAAQPQQTETLRLNRPEPQPAPQPAPVQPAAPQVSAAVPQTTTGAGAGTDAGRTGSNPPPVDAVEARLRDTARGCLAAYRGWRQQPGETSIQALSDAVHELRKALARIEIDMSASRREEQAIRPIPIPAHRTARRTP